MTEQDPLASARVALGDGRWEEARAAFAAALAERETPEALEGMGVALWWLGETRAERMLRDADPNPLRGWLWLMRAYLDPDPARAQELYQRALELARASGDVDLELCALGDLGLTLVTAGRSDEGLALLDEAMAGTLGGERNRLDTVAITCCDVLIACDLAGDLGRATQWCQVADQFIDRYGCPFLYARCRTLYGGVLLAKGRWSDAERELLAAVRMAGGASPGSHAEALARLADLRLRQGRLEEADALLPGQGGGRSAARTAARVRLARGEPAVAVGLLERCLEDGGEPHSHGETHLKAAGAMETLVVAHLALGDLAAASGVAARLAELAAGDDGGQVAALAATAAAHVAGAGGRPEEARRLLERALELFDRLDLPHETALVRLELARALTSANPELAVAEARGALATFERLGANGDADAADALLRSLGAPGRTGPKRVGLLTRREQEVLTLVGLGLSNPEIAQRLFISRKTAAHHVSNVLAKLGVRNRAGAIAYATRQQRD
jgi:DNA-binding CsgD family transcriptional regulator